MDPFPMTVLLATDGSREAELAAHMAIGIAKGTASGLHLVCVVDLGVAGDPRLHTGLGHKGGGLLDDQMRKIREAGVTVARDHLIAGRPDREIVALAEKAGVGPIVMGSVSDSVVRHAHCPVLAAHAGETFP